MHELSIALSILDIATEESERQAGAKPVAIHLRLGPLAGVVRESLVSAFELARDTTDMAACQLVFEHVPVWVDCPGCQGVQPVKSIQQMCCAVCGAPSGQIVSGNELEITAMEMEDPPPTAGHATI